LNNHAKVRDSIFSKKVHMAYTVLFFHESTK
jgi:hypothetical protein